VKRFSRNFVSLLGGDIARRIIGFLAVAVLARKIGVAGFGAINIGFTVLSYTLLLSSAGLNSFGTRAVARGESVNLVNTIVTIRLISSFGAFILISLFAIFFMPNDIMLVLIIIFNLSLFPNIFFIDWYFQGKEKMGIIAVSRLISALAYFILILLIVFSVNELLWVAIAAVIGDILSSSVIWIYYRRNESGERLKFSILGWRSIVRQAIPLGGGSLLASLGVNLSPLVIGILLTNTDVGIFSAANKLVFFLLMLDRVFGATILPAASRHHQESPDHLSKTLIMALKWIFITSLPIAVGGSVVAVQIVPLVFGGEYSPSVDILRILIWFFFFTMLHTIYTTGMIAISKEKAYASIMMISLVMYGISNVICIMLFGIAGAAAAMVVSEAATLILMHRRLNQSIRIPMPGTTVKIIFAAVLMGVIVGIAPPVNVFIKIFFGAIIYIGLLFMLKSISVTEITSILKRV